MACRARRVGAADSFVTGFHLSTNSTFDAGDTVLGERTIVSLAPGQTSDGSTPVTIPPGTSAGTYYVIARADADNAFGETLRRLPEGAVFPQKGEVHAPEVMSAHIKELARFLGAPLCGIVRVSDGGTTVSGLTEGLTPEGILLLRREDGQLEKVLSGQVRPA